MAETSLQSLSPLELATAGLALYGADWRARLAAGLGVSEAELGLVERGLRGAPLEWRGKLVALAQDTALRAMETANALLCRPEQSDVETDIERVARSA